MTAGLARPLLIAAVLLMVAGGWLAPRVEQLRTEAGLAYEPEPGLGVPADIRLLETALGSFRGWLIDILWLRAGQLEQEGRVHESMQLSRWITRLQPNFPQVWSYQAWQLAFNLSLSAKSPEERWLWIEAGISLLRDEGIPINREAWKLYNDLAYIYWFKLGNDSVDEHREYFWRRVAAEWDQVLGPPVGDEIAERVAWLEPIAAAPRERDAFFASRPELAEERAQIEKFLDDEPLAFLAQASRAERGDAELAGWLEDPELGGARRALLAFARAEVLREHYRMDPQLMVDLTREFGPIDWRHPGAHAMYWGAEGALRIETGEPFPKLSSEHRPLLYRNHAVTLGLQQLVLGGNLGGDLVNGELRRAPEWRFIDAYERSIFEGDPSKATEVPEVFQGGYWRILRTVVRAAWLRGEEQFAVRCLGRLRVLYEEAAATPLDFLIAELEGELQEEPEGRDEAIEDLVREQYFEMFREGWGARDPVIAAKRRELAESLRTRGELAGAQLAPAEELESGGLDLFLRAHAWVVSSSAKAQVWRRLSPERRAGVPQPLFERLCDDARRSGLDPAESFPR